MAAQLTFRRTMTRVSSKSDGRHRANLATRYRPDSFASLTGQRHVAAVLRPAIVDGTVPQQLLFSGGSGLGKTTVARIVAAAVLCHASMQERDNGEPCGRCASCVAIHEDRHPDYVEFDAASHGGKDEIREIASRAQTAPLLSTRRVYVIDEAHGLSAAGGQAFLKLLEEPPSHVMFMLCTTDPERMLKTNRGRCTELGLRRPTRAELVANLRRVCTSEGWQVDDRVLETVVECSDPDHGVRGTVNTLQKIAQLLESGNPDDAELSAVLGLAPTARINALLDALGSGTALHALELARCEASDEAIRDGLLRWLRGELATPRRLHSVSAAADLMEMVLRAPAQPAWLDLVVARAALHARPTDAATDTDTSAGNAPAHPASGPAEGHPTRRHPGTATSTRTTPLGTPTESEPVHNRVVPVTVAGDADAPTTPTPANGQLTGTGPAARPGHQEPSDRQATAFRVAVARLDAELATALERCDVSIGAVVHISAPQDLHARIEAGMRHLRVAAGRAGLGVEVTSR